MRRDTDKYEKVHSDGVFIIYHRIEADSETVKPEQNGEDTVNLSKMLENFSN